MQGNARAEPPGQSHRGINPGDDPRAASTETNEAEARASLDTTTPLQPRRACGEVFQACVAAGFYAGGSVVGRGVFDNCRTPLLRGEAVPGVQVDPRAIAACKVFESRPAAPFCADGPICSNTAAVLEMAAWLELGGGARIAPSTASARFSVGGGVDATFGVANFGHPEYGNGSPFHVRVGPWIGLESPLDRVRGEGGLSATLGARGSSGFGTFGARLGAGYGSAGVPDLVGVLSYGVRYVPGRVRCDPPRTPTFAFASGGRFILAVRKETAGSEAFEMILGVEFEPTWLWPPHDWPNNWDKWGGLNDVPAQPC